MQDFTNQKEIEGKFKLQNLSLDDRQKLVGAFTWLIKEDKKQNPALYQRKKIETK